MNLEQTRKLVESLHTEEIKNICMDYLDEKDVINNLRMGTLPELLFQAMCYKLVPYKAVERAVVA